MYYLKLFFVAMIASMLTIGLAGWQAGDAHDAGTLAADGGQQSDSEGEQSGDDEDDEDDAWDEGDW